MREFLKRRVTQAPPEGAALGLALARIRATGENRAAALAEVAIRQALAHDGPQPEMARHMLSRIAQGADPRAAMIADQALRIGAGRGRA